MCEAFKFTLFKAFCVSFYSGWIIRNELRVQYNVFQVLLGLPGWCSASGMFAETRTEGFAAVMKKRSSRLSGGSSTCREDSAMLVNITI